jgi:hypothetical protein
MLCMWKSLIAITAEQSKKIGGPTIHRFAEERGDVVFGDRAPMCVAVAPAHSDNCLPLQALHVVEGLGYRTTRARHEHGLDV